jgi:hypothetical protein
VTDRHEIGFSPLVLPAIGTIMRTLGLADLASEDTGLGGDGGSEAEPGSP